MSAKVPGHSGRLEGRPSETDQRVHRKMAIGLSDLTASGCPLCRAARRGEERHIRWFFLENCYTLPTLLRLERGGYCLRHAARMASSGRAEQLSATFQFLAQMEAHRLRAWRQRIPSGRLGKLLRRGGGQRWLPHRQACCTSCPACEAGATEVAAAILDLRKLLRTDEARRAYQANESGLCRAHLAQVIAEVEDDTARWLVEEALRRLQSVLVDFDLYFHRLDYRFQHEPRGHEQTAWQRALRYFWGEVALDGEREL